MINTDIYGSPEQWEDAYYIQSVIDDTNKRVYFDSGYTRAYLRLGVSAGALSYDTPLDKSLAFCGMSAHLPLSNLHEVVYDTDHFAYGRSIERPVTNWCFAERISNADYIVDMYNRFVHNNDYKYAYWSNGVDDPTNANYNAEPYALVNPKNQVIMIGVIAYDSTFTNHVSCSLADYIDNYTVTYPNISSVYGSLYIGRTNRSTNAGQGDPNTWYATPTIIILDKNNFGDNTEYDYPYNIFFRQAYNKLPIMIADERVYVYDGITLSADADCYVFGDKDLIKLHKVDSSKYIPYIEYSSDFKELALRATAAYGLYFTDNVTTATTGGYTDTDMYLGIINQANGSITEGDYTRGYDNINNPSYNWSDMQQSGYDPAKSVDTTVYTNNTNFGSQQPPTAFTKSWVITENQVKQLAGELWQATLDTQPDQSIIEHNYEVFLTNNPIDCIVSLIKYPVDVIPSIGVPDNIHLGTYETAISANPLAYQTVAYGFVFDTSNYNSLYPVNGGDFRDYEPYTTVTLTVPFCGSVDIPCSYLYQYDDLTVSLIIDYITGACTAVIMCNGIAIKSVSGTCGQQLPLSGIQSATLDAQIQNIAQRDNQRLNTLGLSMTAGAIAIGTAIFTGGATALLAAVTGATVGIATAAANAQQAGEQIDYELSHMQTPIKSVSSASPAIAQSMDLRCKLCISRPVMGNYNAEVYADTVGFACLINTTVRQLHGLTVGNIDLDGVAATATEKDYIKQAFATGVYL